MKRFKVFFLMCIIAVMSIIALGCSEEETEQIKDEIVNAVNDYLDDLGNQVADSVNDALTGDSSMSTADDTIEPTAEADVTVTQTAEPDENDDSSSELTDASSELKPDNEKEPTATPTATPEPTATPTPTLAPTATPTPTIAPTLTPTPTVTPVPTKAAKNYLRFRNYNLLDQHYEKHGIEMGFANREDYEAAAAAVVVNPEALHKTEAEDGDDIYYVESTNEFVVVSKDGYIRTYFLPSAGKKYYDRQ